MNEPGPQPPTVLACAGQGHDHRLEGWPGQQVGVQQEGRYERLIVVLHREQLEAVARRAHRLTQVSRLHKAAVGQSLVGKCAASQQLGTQLSPPLGLSHHGGRHDVGLRQ